MRTSEDFYRRVFLPRIVRDEPKSISKYRLNIKKEQEIAQDYSFIMNNLKSFKYLLNDEQYNKLVNLKIEHLFVNNDKTLTFEVKFPQDEELIKELDSKSCSWSRFLYAVYMNDYKGLSLPHRSSSSPHSESEINILIDLFLPSDRMLMLKTTVQKVKHEGGRKFQYIDNAFPAYVIHPLLSLKSFCFIQLTRNINPKPKVYNLLWNRMNDEERLSCHLYKKGIYGEDKHKEALKYFRGLYKVFVVEEEYLGTQSAKDAVNFKARRINIEIFTHRMFDLAEFITELVNYKVHIVL